MEEIKNKKSFNGRSFTSIVLFSFLINLIISGIMIQVTEEQTISISKVYFRVLHNITAILFIVFSFVHIAKNWRAMKGHMKKANLGISKEMITAFILTNLIILGCWILSRFLAQAHGFAI
jgi:hypothetical protein